MRAYCQIVAVEPLSRRPTGVSRNDDTVLSSDIFKFVRITSSFILPPVAYCHDSAEYLIDCIYTWLLLEIRNYDVKVHL